MSLQTERLMQHSSLISSVPLSKLSGDITKSKHDVLTSNGNCSNNEGGCGATVVDVGGGLVILKRCGTSFIQRWICLTSMVRCGMSPSRSGSGAAVISSGSLVRNVRSPLRHPSIYFHRSSASTCGVVAAVILENATITIGSGTQHGR